jgi:hypothetical protein
MGQPRTKGRKSNQGLIEMEITESQFRRDLYLMFIQGKNDVAERLAKQKIEEIIDERR